MRLGHVRDNFPRIILSLPGRNGMVAVEFIVDTGLRESPYCKLMIDWNDEERLTEILAMEGNPLLGSELMYGSLLQIEMTDGGEVSIEPL